MDEENIAIVKEEERLLDKTIQVINEFPEGAGRSPGKIHKEMLVLRDEIISAKSEDLPSLYEQMNHLNHIMDQIEKSQKKEELNPDSPSVPSSPFSPSAPLQVAYECSISESSRTSFPLRSLPKSTSFPPTPDGQLLVCAA